MGLQLTQNISILSKDLWAGQLRTSLAGSSKVSGDPRLGGRYQAKTGGLLGLAQKGGQLGRNGSGSGAEARARHPDWEGGARELSLQRT